MRRTKPPLAEGALSRSLDSYQYHRLHELILRKSSLAEPAAARNFAPMNHGSTAPLTAPLRNYPLLLSSQFLGAFGDNVILAVILGPVMKSFQAHEITAQHQQIANIVYTSLLFIPYLFFAPIAGYFNDRFPKTRGLMAGNGLKMIGAILAWLSLAHENYWLGIGY